MNILKRLPSRFEALPEFFSFLDVQLKQELNLSHDLLFHVKLVLEEALTNAIKHGNKFDPDRHVEVKISVKGDRLVMRVKDEGAGFDFERLPDPTLQERLMRISGRGVFLIRQLMDEVSFHDGGREIRMVMQLSRKSRPGKA